jgi:hypothetical protein
MRFGCGMEIQVSAPSGASFRGTIVEANDIEFILQNEVGKRICVAWDLELTEQCSFQIISSEKSIYVKNAA